MSDRRINPLEFRSSPVRLTITLAQCIPGTNLRRRDDCVVITHSKMSDSIILGRNSSYNANRFYSGLRALLRLAPDDWSASADAIGLGANATKEDTRKLKAIMMSRNLQAEIATPAESTPSIDTDFAIEPVKDHQHQLPDDVMSIRPAMAFQEKDHRGKMESKVAMIVTRRDGTESYRCRFDGCDREMATLVKISGHYVGAHGKPRAATLKKREREAVRASASTSSATKVAAAVMKVMGTTNSPPYVIQSLTIRKKFPMNDATKLNAISEIINDGLAETHAIEMEDLRCDLNDALERERVSRERADQLDADMQALRDLLGSGS